MQCLIYKEINIGEKKNFVKNTNSNNSFLLRLFICSYFDYQKEKKMVPHGKNILDFGIQISDEKNLFKGSACE